MLWTINIIPMYYLKMLIQIYEIQTPLEAEKCIESGVDHIGSVLLSEENRHSPVLKDVMRLTEGTDIKNSIIPLFKDIDTLYRALDYYQPHYVHFCDSLTDHNGREVDLDNFIEVQSNLKKKFPEIKIMRSIPVPKRDINPNFPTLKIARSLEPASDIFLTDTFLEKGPVNGFIGITGETADWKIARGLVLQSRIPVILAGGLSPENVYGAITEVLPAGADSCTLTNRMDKEGKAIRFNKDFGKVKKFVKEVRRAENEISREQEEREKKLAKLREELREREAALPPHSVRPHQLMAIEEIEEEIALLEKGQTSEG